MLSRVVLGVLNFLFSKVGADEDRISRNKILQICCMSHITGLLYVVALENVKYSTSKNITELYFIDLIIHFCKAKWIYVCFYILKLSQISIYMTYICINIQFMYYKLFFNLKSIKDFCPSLVLNLLVTNINIRCKTSCINQHY